MIATLRNMRISAADFSAHRQIFKERFRREATVGADGPIRAEDGTGHTDYSIRNRLFAGEQILGTNFGMPFALDQRILAVGGLNGTRRVNIYSTTFSESHSFDIEGLRAPQFPGSWGSYMESLWIEAAKKGYPLRGMDMVIGGEVPIGRGVSTSAALDVAHALVQGQLNSWDLPLTAIAELAQATEHGVGVFCGLLDPLASLFGEKGKAILLDFGTNRIVRTVDYSRLLATGLNLYLIDSGVKRGLGDTYYNSRRNEVENAGLVMAKLFGRENQPNVSNYEYADLTDAKCREFLAMAKGQFDATDEMAQAWLNRAKHVLADKLRCIIHADAAESGNRDEYCRTANATGLDLSMLGRFAVSASLVPMPDGTLQQRSYLDLLRSAYFSAYFGNRPLNLTETAFRLCGGGGGGRGLAAASGDLKGRTGAINFQYHNLQHLAGYPADQIYSAEVIPVSPADGAGIRSFGG